MFDNADHRLSTETMRHVGKKRQRCISYANYKEALPLIVVSTQFLTSLYQFYFVLVLGDQSSRVDLVFRRALW